jgi:hypothetical protein
MGYVLAIAEVLGRLHSRPQTTITPQLRLAPSSKFPTRFYFFYVAAIEQ